MMQGATLVSKVHQIKSWERRRAHAARSASISAWAVGLWWARTASMPSERSSSPSTINEPTGSIATLNGLLRELDAPTDALLMLLTDRPYRRRLDAAWMARRRSIAGFDP